MSDPITLLLVDDHELVRQGVRAFMATQEGVVVVGEAATADAAVALAERHAPDVVLMDLVLADGDGVEATRRVKRISPRSRVVILTSYHDDDHIFPALKAGALSYLLKDVGMAELLAVVRKAARGETSIHPRIAERMVAELQRGAAGEDAPHEDLTRREREILMLIAEGLDNRDIAARLGLSDYTVKGHVSNVLSKLHLSDRTKAAVFAWRQGLIGRNSG